MKKEINSCDKCKIESDNLTLFTFTETGEYSYNLCPKCLEFEKYLMEKRVLFLKEQIKKNQTELRELEKKLYGNLIKLGLYQPEN